MKKNDDFEELEKRIEELRKKESPVSKPLEKPSFIYATATGFRIGIELLSGVLVGAGLGYLLDNVLDTKPFMLIFLIFFGFGAGVLNVYRFAKTKEEKKE